MIREIEHKAVNGALAVVLLLAATAFLVAAFINAARTQQPQRLIGIMLAFPLLVLCWKGLLVVQPNQGKALLLFGRYSGTVRASGLWWVNPFYTARAISLRVRNFETTKLKVNDHNSSDRDRGGRGLAGDRFGGSAFRGGQLRGLRQSAERIGAAWPGEPVSL